MALAKTFPEPRSRLVVGIDAKHLADYFDSLLELNQANGQYERLRAIASKVIGGLPSSHPYDHHGEGKLQVCDHIEPNLDHGLVDDIPQIIVSRGMRRDKEELGPNKSKSHRRSLILLGLLGRSPNDFLPFATERHCNGSLDPFSACFFARPTSMIITLRGSVTYIDEKASDPNGMSSSVNSLHSNVSGPESRVAASEMTRHEQDITLRHPETSAAVSNRKEKEKVDAY
ncbi:hypothetical protein M5K25_021979 [Dendrobium thyrsiflorum]|uniref:Uncharacterized protein n=1 Tax=Dendrobium thyrsiflorum TaxID=117978 RepID=A0ABD0U5G5_DENTH